MPIHAYAISDITAGITANNIGRTKFVPPFLLINVDLILLSAQPISVKVFLIWSRYSELPNIPRPTQRASDKAHPMNGIHPNIRFAII